MTDIDDDMIERAIVAQERQAEALETIAGALLLAYDTEHGGYNAEALLKEARFHATVNMYEGL